MEATYVVDDKAYDVAKLSAEGQKAFQLLAIAEQRVQNSQNNLVIDQAAAVALHQKVQEYLTDEALQTTEE
jgi:CRISPR/Cas system-associated endoribonuclease Cas2